VVKDKEGDYVWKKSEISRLYKRSNSEINIEQLKYGVMGRSYKYGVMKFISYYLIDIEKSTVRVNKNSEYSDKILEAIQIHSAVASVDTLVNYHYMGLAWIISDCENKYKQKGEIWSNKWTKNTNASVEAMELYNLILEIDQNTKHLKEGSVDIHSDCSKIINAVHDGLSKASDGIRDGGAAICRIVNKILGIMIEIYLYYIEGYAKVRDTF